ncbi:helix-turn-helix domain-containing protein [Acetobacter persici]|uniref:helix-turn-helix domain-containing protein n=1 Tax=Acetobacter persici TaxID=1076596 RepID=UPI0039E86875
MARMTLAEIKARPSGIDWKRVNATTNEDIDRHAKEDGTDNELPGLPYPTPATVRRHLKLTQKEIAALAGVPVATWRNWEQGRVGLDPAVRTLLRVLWREPDAVRRAMVA